MEFQQGLLHREDRTTDEVINIQTQAGPYEVTEIDDQSSGPASLMITDPDGNVILLDQHR